MANVWDYHWYWYSRTVLFSSDILTCFFLAHWQSNGMWLCLMIYSMPTFPLFCFVSLFLFASFSISLSPIPCCTIVCTPTGYSPGSVVISPWIAKKAKFLVTPENSRIRNKFREESLSLLLWLQSKSSQTRQGMILSPVFFLHLRPSPTTVNLGSSHTMICMII